MASFASLVITIKSDTYTTIPIQSIIFTYGIREGLAFNKNNELLNKDLKYQSYYNNKLPITLNPEDYGKIMKKISLSEGSTYYIRVNTKVSIILNQTIIDNKKVNNVDYFRNGNLIQEWIDKETNPLIPNSFTREIGSSTYYYEGGELVLIKMRKKTGRIKQAKKDYKLENKFITMDLETQLTETNKGLIHTPYLLSWYGFYPNSDGILEEITKSYYITDYKDFGDLLKNVFKDLLPYKGYTVYFHNFAKFDSYFLLKYLIEFGEINPIIHNNKLISLTFTYNKNLSNLEEESTIEDLIGTKLIFNDSYLLLPSSLKNLSKSFNVSKPKSIFPFGLNDLNYSGAIPDYKYFNNISQEEYNSYAKSYTNQIWDFKNEAIKYCNLDCKSLYQVLIKFNSLIFKKFKLNIINYPTTPSLAFKIYRSQSKFFPKDSIAMLTGDIESEIRKSYTQFLVILYFNFYLI